MLFLAVFLGFIAENIRENISDAHREKDLAIELYGERERNVGRRNNGRNNCRFLGS